MDTTESWQECAYSKSDWRDKRFVKGSFTNSKIQIFLLIMTEHNRQYIKGLLMNSGMIRESEFALLDDSQIADAYSFFSLCVSEKDASGQPVLYNLWHELQTMLASSLN